MFAVAAFIFAFGIAISSHGVEFITTLCRSRMTPGSTGRQPVVVGSLPTTFIVIQEDVAVNVRLAFREAAEKDRLAACAPRTRVARHPIRLHCAATPLARIRDSAWQ